MLVFVQVNLFTLSTLANLYSYAFLQHLNLQASVRLVCHDGTE